MSQNDKMDMGTLGGSPGGEVLEQEYAEQVHEEHLQDTFPDTVPEPMEPSDYPEMDLVEDFPNVDETFMAIAKSIEANGHDKGDRTGTGTRSTFGQKMVFDVSGGKLALITTKKIFTRSFIHEMLWFISGQTNIKYLKENGVSIWDNWTRPDSVRKAYVHGVMGEMQIVDGDIGPGYGKQWRRWPDTRLVDADLWKNKYETFKKRGFEMVAQTVDGQVVIHRDIDQLQDVINQIKHNPDSRRIIMSAWNAAEIDEMMLPPCHTFTQWYTQLMSAEEALSNVGITSLLWQQIEDYEGIFRNKDTVIYSYPPNSDKTQEDVVNEIIEHFNIPTRRLYCQLYCRSQDFLVGSPFNIAQYSLLMHMVAQVTNTVADTLIWIGGDTHIYQNQFELFQEQKERESIACVPRVVLNPEIKNIDDFTFEDITIEGYESWPRIDYPVAI